jgi:hypothetical protein
MDQNIAAAIAAASQVAANVQMPAVVQQASVPAALPAGRVRSLDDALYEAGVNVVEFAKVTESAFTINGKRVEKIEGFISFDEVKINRTVRFNVGGGTKFLRTYNLVTEAQSGRPWTDVVAQAQKSDDKCKGDYDAAEIPVALLADLKVGEKTYKAGDRIGITTPVTGYKPFMAWYREARAEFGPGATVPVTAWVDQKSKPGVRDYGLPTITTRRTAN